MAVVYLLTDGITRALVVWLCLLENVIGVGGGGLRAVLLVRLAHWLTLHTNNG